MYASSTTCAWERPGATFDKRRPRRSAPYNYGGTSIVITVLSLDWVTVITTAGLWGMGACTSFQAGSSCTIRRPRDSGAFGVCGTRPGSPTRRSDSVGSTLVSKMGKRSGDPVLVVGTPGADQEGIDV